MDNNKRTAAIVVDYDYYEQNRNVRRFVAERAGKASLVLLVSSPDAQDPLDYEGSLEWNVVIRNSKGLPDEAFKVAALEAVSNYSNLIPVLSIDLFNKGIYEDAGILMALDGGYFG